MRAARALPETIGESGELSRRERRKLELRARILEAAYTLFETRGFHATRVSDVCERADVAHKTFFNHFPSKQHVLRAIAEAGLESLLSDIEEARKRTASTRERLLWFFDRVADRNEQAGPMRRELLTEMIHAAHEARTGSEQARALHDAFEGLVREGLVAGDVTERHTPETLADMLLGAFYALMLNWANLDRYPLRRQARAAARFMADALAAQHEGGRP